MLVLTRKKDQTIVINDNIEITVLDIQGDQVRIGINAPRSVSIHRKEVYMEIQQENKAAARLNPETSKASLEEILKNTLK
jgi:carbon storage regulator